VYKHSRHGMTHAPNKWMIASPFRRGMTEHRPLGSIMRVRQRSYELSADFRASHNHVAIVEPRCPFHLG
jgi:hypothetical protein